MKNHAEYQIRLMGEHLYSPLKADMKHLQEIRDELDEILDKLFEMAKGGVI